MSDQYENFRNLVASGGDLTRARWEAVSDKIIGDAERHFGVQLSREDIVAMPSARIATLTDEPLSPLYMDEIQQLEGVKEQVRQKELREALEQGDEDSHAELSRLTPEKRLTRARELGMIDKRQQSAPTSVADEATLLRRLMTLNPAERIAKARAWGLM
ncbi:hypothetical protein [Ruegeria sp. Ofav3-42]|uniref:hypothetical protein n=1 Tax=Ruegeria sp. Ofav3-42 TaxID=2917759 RepID=UPI001EF4A179|nr:hypothetical protein [Ruegeria sp. Ofav3-42]MCG7518448.1 hypothetical protein [Ruegeria sp. Ofav3-42]